MSEFKLVPVEPTEEMLRVEVSPALCIGGPDNPRVGQWRLGLYRAMLAAAPQPPALGDIPTLRYMFDWAAAICCDGPRDWRACFEEDLPHPDFFKDGQAKNLVELVDRAHVTRLQAEASQLRQYKNDYMESAEETRRALQAELDEAVRLGKYAAACGVEAEARWDKERERLQARTAELEGLLRDCVGPVIDAANNADCEANVRLYSNLRESINAALAEGAKS